MPLSLLSVSVVEHQQSTSSPLAERFPRGAQDPSQTRSAPWSVCHLADASSAPPPVARPYLLLSPWRLPLDPSLREPSPAARQCRPQSPMAQELPILLLLGRRRWARPVSRFLCSSSNRLKVFQFVSSSNRYSSSAPWRSQPSMPCPCNLVSSSCPPWWRRRFSSTLPKCSMICSGGHRRSCKKIKSDHDVVRYVN
eukprot:XP_008678230.1 uncharacterized protein LOC103653029 isoform X1 [Zea mays]